MNATETLPQISHRLSRIKNVSRIVRYILLALFLGTFVKWLFYSFLLQSPPSREGTYYFLLTIVTGIMVCAWYWELMKLFRFYERGLIFAFVTVRCIKSLGILCVVNWLLIEISHFVLHPHAAPAPLPPGVKVVSVSHISLPGPFIFVIFGVDVVPLLAGLIIVIIAWIMDEGRKIQEEQALTV